MMATRHDAQMLSARSVPVDPYQIWLEQRDAERGASTVWTFSGRPARERGRATGARAGAVGVR